MNEEKRAKTFLSTISAIILIAISLLLIFLSEEASKKLILPAYDVSSSSYSLGIDETAYPVTRIVDGDTIEIKIGENKETVRLIGVNTPETVDPRKEVECFGKEASNKMKELLFNKNVNIANDPTQAERDKYGRLLLYIYRSDDNLFINRELIKTGFAYEYTYDKPYIFQDDFKKLQKEAQSNKIGLWNSCLVNN